MCGGPRYLSLVELMTPCELLRIVKMDQGTTQPGFDAINPS